MPNLSTATQGSASAAREKDLDIIHNRLSNIADRLAATRDRLKNVNGRLFGDNRENPAPAPQAVGGILTEIGNVLDTIEAILGETQDEANRLNTI